MQDLINWHCFDSADQVATAVCLRVLNAAKQAISERGAFKLVLAGGTTPEKVYRLLAGSQADWEHWFIYHGDERCLPVNHEDRNSLMVENAWLNHVAIPKEQVFHIPAELDPKTAAQQYQDTIKMALPFDMVLLGMGEDGHTASLFPNHHHDVSELTHAVFNSPKPPSERVSLSAKALSDTKALLFLITGENKREAVQAWRAGDMLPVACIEPKQGIDVYIDNAAEPSTF